jgi:hypothetical protein
MQKNSKSFNKWLVFNTYIQYNPYHLVTRSPWPILLSIYFGLFVLSCVLYLHYQLYFIKYPFDIIVFILSRWFLDIWIESLLGRHTKKVAKGLRLGFFLMIISEIMFFVSFFWSLFHFTLNVDVWTGIAWPYVWGVPPFDGTPHT